MQRSEEWRLCPRCPDAHLHVKYFVPSVLSDVKFWDIGMLTGDGPPPQLLSFGCSIKWFKHSLRKHYVECPHGNHTRQQSVSCTIDWVCSSVVLVMHVASF